MKNFIPKEALLKCRKRFESEIKLGRMVAGFGESKRQVRHLLGRDIFTSFLAGRSLRGGSKRRCFSFVPVGGKSINTSLLDNSVEYITFVERVKTLSRVDWYVSVDMKNGYRQVPVHPEDWF